MDAGLPTPCHSQGSRPFRQRDCGCRAAQCQPVGAVAYDPQGRGTLWGQTLVEAGAWPALHAGEYLLGLAQRVLPQMEHAERVLTDIAQGRRGPCAPGWSATRASAG
jgi:hypothetical protein